MRTPVICSCSTCTCSVVHVLVGQLLHPQERVEGEQHAQTLGGGGMRRNRKRISLMKPRSNMRSASSKTTTWMLPRSMTLT